MGTIIITQLFLLPWIEGVNASDARAAFNEGNRWLEEEEYQKAIESFESATARLPSFSEAWRAKGIAEIKKADGLSRLMRPDADTYYRNAIKSFSHVKNQDGQDSVVTKGLARAFMNIGEERKALSIVTSAYNAQDPDPEMASLIQELTKLMNTKGNVPQQTS
jgi:tetratricopeptide (TPR) repeat protein